MEPIPHVTLNNMELIHLNNNGLHIAASQLTVVHSMSIV